MHYQTNGLSLRRPFFIITAKFFIKISKYINGKEVDQYPEEPIGEDFFYPDWQ